MAFRILHLDDHLVAIRKPPGWVVHRSAMSRERRAVLQQLRNELGRHLWPVHRLDRATSGVLLFALAPEAASLVADQFRRRTARKHYLAVVRGWMGEEGVIDHPVRIAQGSRERKPAVTAYRRLARVELPVAVDRYPTSRYSLVEARPLTGRYQQIRQHFKHDSHPIIGDATWGNGRHNRFFRDHFGLRRLLLHAWRLELTHPASGEPLVISAGIDREWRRLFERLGWDYSPFTNSST